MTVPAPLADGVYTGRIATMEEGGAPYGAIRHGGLAVRAGRIAWVGERGGLPSEFHALAERRFDGWLTPALIDCHTHLVFAGDRAAEFEARLGGESYAHAAREGRGILSTVRATRAADEATLIAAAAPRLRRLIADGVRTVEIKSGYGLDLETELRMLRAARALGVAHGARVRTTLLAAHAVPPEFIDADAYIDYILAEIMPAALRDGIADAVDAFAEAIAFTPDQVRRLFRGARALGLPVKVHADQLTEGGGAALAAEFAALSADHLEYTSEAGAAAMARAGTVAVMLPAAYATVGAARPPPIAAFRAAGVKMAVATDCNPGSAPCCSLLYAANLACCLFRLTPEEALAGMTRNAARALGLSEEAGTLAQGKAAEALHWPIDHPREIAYWMGGLAPDAV